MVKSTDIVFEEFFEDFTKLKLLRRLGPYYHFKLVFFFHLISQMTYWHGKYEIKLLIKIHIKFIFSKITYTMSSSFEIRKKQCTKIIAAAMALNLIRNSTLVGDYLKFGNNRMIKSPSRLLINK